MIRAEHLELRRGSRALIHDASFTIHPGQRVGVIGRNGTGKSSLFAALQGEIGIDAGELYRPERWVLAAVAQHLPATRQPALAFALDGDTQLKALREQWSEAEARHDGEALAQLTGAIEDIGGFEAESRAARLLRGLGFSDADLKRPVDDFSGGWKMRLMLAQALMQRSDLLLLDEPTNHLDLDTVLWLERWLVAYRGTLLVISHDREFLDAVCTHSLHLDGESARLYSGGYSEFARQRANELVEARRMAAEVADKRAHLMRFVERFRAKASKARQAQSRLKALQRLEEAPVPPDEADIVWQVPQPPKLPDPLLRLRELAAGYGERRVLSDVRVELAPGDRVGLLGRNGAGKSTLMKLLAGVLQPQAGERLPARDLSIGYFAQSQVEELDGALSPIELLREAVPSFNEQQARDYLGGFGYSGEMATTPLAPRSGGEKARLALAMLLVHKPNLILLDEPTNHLDLAAREALIRALQEFPGAVVLVSHDRALLEASCERYLRVVQGRVQEYSEDLDSYAELLRREVAETPVGKPSDAPASSAVARSGVDHRERRALQNRLKRVEEQLAQAQQTLGRIETDLATASAAASQDAAKLTQLIAARGDAAAKVEALENEWLELAASLEA